MSLKWHLSVAALIAILSGCAGVDKVGPEVALPPAAQHAVAEAVANQMKDPNSAEFRNWHAFQSQQGLLVCGEVNAKNSYGGYVGFTHFVAHASPEGQLLTQSTLSAND
jgi:uncharacterized membrane protein YagU involved in acid resistance